MTRNEALAKTIPDTTDNDRPSYVRASTGAPLSRYLKSDSDRVREMKGDLVAGGMTIGQIATRLELLAVRLESRSRVAEALEQHCAAELEARRG